MSLIDWNKLTITEPPVLPRELLRNTKNFKRGLKKDSIRSPYSLEKPLYAASVLFLKARITSTGKVGKSKKKFVSFAMNFFLIFASPKLIRARLN